MTGDSKRKSIFMFAQFGNDFAKEKWKVDNTNLGNIECCETQCKGYN